MSDLTNAGLDHASLEKKATDHLWMHFTRQSMQPEGRLPIITGAKGHHLIDSRGRKLFDGLSGLFTTNAGHGRERLAEVAKKQIEQLDFFPIWSFSHPAAIELADRLADLMGLAEAVAFQRLDQRLAGALLGHGSPLLTTHQALDQGAELTKEALRDLLDEVQRDGSLSPALGAALRRIAASGADISAPGKISHTTTRKSHFLFLSRKL